MKMSSFGKLSLLLMNSDVENACYIHSKLLTKLGLCHWFVFGVVFDLSVVVKLQ